MTVRGARPRIAWGASFANYLEIAGPPGQALNYSLPGAGSEFDLSPAGVADSWVYGPDQFLEVVVRWIPIHDTTRPLGASGWDGWDDVYENLLENGDFAQPLSVQWDPLGGYSAYFSRVADTGPAGQAYAMRTLVNNWSYPAHPPGAFYRPDIPLYPVNFGDRYRFSAYAKQLTGGLSGGTVYLGLSSYDQEGRWISPQCNYAPNGLGVSAVLQVRTQEGDATITLDDATDFPDESGSGFNTYLVFGCAEDGSDLPNQTYTRYVSKSGNVLTLFSTTIQAALGQVWPAGTPVRFVRSGGNHHYITMAAVAPSAIPSSWTLYTGDTVAPPAVGGAPGSGIMPGTRYVAPWYSQSGSVTGGTTDLRLSDVRLERLATAGLGWRAFLEWAREMNQFRWYPDAAHPAVYYPMYLVEPLTDAGVSLERGGRHRSLRLVMRTADRAVVAGY